MLKFPLDSGETFLILAPRWADLGANLQLGLLALLFLLPLCLIVWLCRYELRLVTRWQACGLLSLRLLMLVVLWCVIGLQPHLADIHVEQKPSRVLIAVDLSTSMDMIDTQRRPEEKLRLARALKLNESLPSPDDGVFEEWIRQYEAGKTVPDWITARERYAEAIRQRLTAERKRWHDEALAAVDALSRKAIIARILSRDGLNLLDRLAARHEVEVVGFDEHLHGLLESQLFEQLTPAKANQNVLASNLRLPLAQRSSRRDSPLAGIVLFSDGQHNIGPSPHDLAEQLGKQRLPIFPVVIGAREPPNDLMIFDVQAPDKVFKDATVPVEIRCKVTNLAAHEFAVEMQMDGQPVKAEHRKVIQHQGPDKDYSVQFQAKMDKAGTHVASVKATSKEKEITLANNQATHVIRVADEKVHVLLVDGEARWEYIALANAFLRDSAVQLERIVFVQPRIGMIKESDLQKVGLPKTKWPEPKADAKESDPLMNFDCILLGDVAPEQLPIAERRRLEKFVAERGGTLILMAGKRYLPFAYLKPAPAEDDPLVRMFPLTDAEVVNSNSGFTLQLTPEGKRRPFLQLKPRLKPNGQPEEEEEKRHPFGELDPKREGLVTRETPKHFWGIVGKRKPGASVLLEPRWNAVPPPPKGESEPGIVLQKNYGRGRVIFIGLDSTWRWRQLVGDTYHHAFWGQLARSSVDRLLPAGNRFVRYGPRDPKYSEGQPVELAVRLHDSLPPLKDLSQARVKLHRQKADGSEELIAVISLSANGQQSLLLEAAVRDLPAGTYRMEVDIPPYAEQLAIPDGEKDRSAKEGALFVILPRQLGELRNLATNFPLLQSLANHSGGKWFTPLDVEQVVDRLARRIEKSEYREESKPWQDEPMVWWLLGILLGLFTFEWVWRKRLDLP